MLANPTPRFPFLLAVAVWLLAAVSVGVGLSPRLENPFLDWNLKRLAERLPPDPEIVLLDIDEPTLEAMAPAWGRYPWSRAVYGTLLEGLARQQPRAVLFDILFVDPHKEHVQDDLYFIEVARKLPNVYFSMVRLQASADPQGIALKDVKAVLPTPRAKPEARAALLLPLPGLADTGRVGAINVDKDADGVIRRYPVYYDLDGWRLASLPARVARDLGVTVPEDNEQTLVWHGPARTYTTVSLHEVFADFERGKSKRPPDEFRNKIVIIGTTAPGLHDIKLTPMGADFPGPEVLATAIDNLKNGERLKQLPTWTLLVVTALALAVLAQVFARGASPARVGAWLLPVTLGLAIGGWATLVYARTVVPVTGVIVFSWLYFLPAAVRAFWLERQQRQRVTQLFSRFLDPRVVAGLVEKGATDSTLTGQKRDITVLFSDIRGFTTLSEQKTPQEIVDILNRYFSRQVEVIFRHGGTLDKYIGDAIMAFWGAPTEQPDHARRALAAAREMEQTLLTFRKEMGADGEHFDIGIGLNSGEAVVGFIGSPEHRQDYTVIGDTVNTASRIEGATKGRARILVSEATRNAVGPDVTFKDHGFAKLKGKGEEVRLYEPLWDPSTT
ncbi:MAG: adenylate/guanylate cyclase domain-containing protein [Gammaproteobacteria bacterium]|nr:adenylate/guanylate cyclase domain-containing protein [Gammaproteobacteria bacterium]